MRDYDHLKKQCLHIIGFNDGEESKKLTDQQSLIELCKAYNVKASESVVVDISPFYQTPWGRKLFIEKYKGSIPLVQAKSEDTALPAPIGEGSENIYFPE